MSDLTISLGLTLRQIGRLYVNCLKKTLNIVYKFCDLELFLKIQHNHYYGK